MPTITLKKEVFVRLKKSQKKRAAQPQFINNAHTASGEVKVLLDKGEAK